MAEPLVLVSTTGHIRHLQLNRAEKMNAANRQMLSELSREMANQIDQMRANRLGEQGQNSNDPLGRPLTGAGNVSPFKDFRRAARAAPAPHLAAGSPGAAAAPVAAEPAAAIPGRPGVPAAPVVGQGGATLVRTSSRTLLFDAGPLRLDGSDLVERVLSPDGDSDVGIWLSCSHKVHDIAFVEYPEKGKLHHCSFLLESWEQVLRAGDIMSMNKVAVDIGPTRHGVTRGCSTP